MNDFLKTRYGQEFVANISSIAGSLEKIADELKRLNALEKSITGIEDSLCNISIEFTRTTRGRY